MSNLVVEGNDDKETWDLYGVINAAETNESSL